MTELFATLPKKWKIGSYKFAIQVVSSDHAGLTGNDGMTDFQDQIIYLDESMKPARAAVVTLHEAIHVINWVYGVNDGAEEEAITTQISTGLMAFWHDNPRVMQWINKVRRK